MVFLLQQWRVKRPLLLMYILLTKLFQLDFLSERLVNLLRFSVADVLSIMFLSSVTNLPPRGEGTFGISGWGCAAGTLEALTYTRARSAEFCYPILE